MQALQTMFSPHLVDTRLVIFHKQATSARLRFVCFRHGLFAFGATDDSELELMDEDEDAAPRSAVEWHPATLQRMAEGYLGLQAGASSMEPEFHAVARTNKGFLRLRALALTAIDPPFAAIERIGGRFISITEARSMNALEREALRRVYAHVLG
ncbi:MAG: hypothetical protein AB1717_03255 [Pseudomonadota bacterium]